MYKRKSKLKRRSRSKRSSRSKRNSRSRLKPDWVIYGANYCPFCLDAKSLAKRRGLDYIYINMDRLSLKEFEGLTVKTKGYKYIPQIFYKGKFIGGFDKMEKKLNY